MQDPEQNVGATNRSGLNFDSDGNVLQVTGVKELSAVNSTGFRENIQSELRLRHSSIELDLSEIQFMDSQGLGALIAIQNRLAKRKGGLRVMNPTPQARKIFELTQMGRVFEIFPTLEPRSEN
jgi:anti-sigma B factor antagonist